MKNLITYSSISKTIGMIFSLDNNYSLRLIQKNVLTIF